MALKKGKAIAIAGICFVQASFAIVKALDWVPRHFPPFIEPEIAVVGYVVAMALLLSKPYSGYIICTVLFSAELIFAAISVNAGTLPRDADYLVNLLVNFCALGVGLFFTLREVREWSKVSARRR